MRHSGGKKVPVAIQRMRAEDLLAAVFPAQVACQDNNPGPVEIPDHPLVNETLKDCLHEAMSLEGLQEILSLIENGAIRTLAVDTPAPSPMAHEILNANPYAFLDDAPLEERRARAVSLRRVDPWLGREFGQLDQEAIAEVCRQAWPEIRNPDELHDLLLDLGILPVEKSPDWKAFAEKLVHEGRATIASWATDESQLSQAYVAAERCDLVKLGLAEVTFMPPISVPLNFIEKASSEEAALQKIVQGWAEVLGPTTVGELAVILQLPANKIEAALIALETDGVVLRGEFRSGGAGLEWCERSLLARIHRLTLGRMRKEIEPVSAAELIKFLLSWQHALPENRLRGRDGVLEVIRQLQGLELPAPAWEQHVLPARIENYDPADLEHLCLAGVICWGRLRSADDPNDDNGAEIKPGRRAKRLLAPARNAPIAFLLREELDCYLEKAEVLWDEIPTLSPMAREVARYLEQRGASFLTDIAKATGLLKVKVEEALWQLVAHGLATGDGIAGLRVLLTPEHKRAGKRRGLRVISGGRSAERMMPVGRWSLWRQLAAEGDFNSAAALERKAAQLLQRYGIVFRDLLARESNPPPWRTLLQVYRRLEARGEIRGGRFVNGFVGEQFALPEAVEKLRAERRAGESDEPVIISSADPLNLVGVLTPGSRISPYSNQVIAYQNGIPVEVGPLGAVLSKLQQGNGNNRMME
jgi:ATP-dependent Lhr-like helicase